MQANKGSNPVSRRHRCPADGDKTDGKGEKNRYKQSKHRIYIRSLQADMRPLTKKTLRAAMVILLVIGIIAAATGVIERPIEKIGLGKISAANEDYLRRSLDKAVTGFLVLSGIKTGLAVIEGSEVGVGFNLELGDLVQSVYDYVDIAWKTALAGGTVILLTRLALKAVGLVDHWVLAFCLLAVSMLLIAKWFIPEHSRIYRIMRETTFFSVVFTCVFYLVFPFAIAGAAFLSEKITDPLIAESQRSFESIKDEFTIDQISRRLFPEAVKKDEGWFSGLDVKKKLEKTGEHVKKQTEYFKEKSRSIAVWTLQLIAGYLFDSIVFPVTFFILLFIVTKAALLYMFEERKQQSLKQDVAALVEGLETSLRRKGSRRPLRLKMLRRFRRYRR